MKIHLIKKQSLIQFGEKFPYAKHALLRWLAIMNFVDWDFPDDIKKTFGSADLLGNGSNRVIFNIRGNRYRMICKYHFGNERVHIYVCWIGSHKEYETLCLQNKQYDVNEF
jgi:mRNA interferase HigB